MYVELKNINKNFGDYKASDNVNFGVEKGKLIGLLGPSGSGKTTILRMIAGLETPDSGDIIIDGVRVNDLAASKRGIGFVFQNYALFRYMTVYDNIAFARALAPNPQLLLLDEPFAAIDAKVRKELRSWLREMIEKLGVTSIFVTHDQDEAIEVADEIIITNKGRIEQTGTPIEIYHNPKTAFTASFFGETTFVDDYSKFHNFEHIENVEKAIVRPEFVKVTKKNEVQKYKSSASHGVTKNVLFRGDSIEVVVDVDGTELKARRGLDEQAIEVGEEVDVFLYRIFVTVGDKAYLLDNKSISEDSLVI